MSRQKIGLDSNVILHHIETLMLDDDYKEAEFNIALKVISELDNLKEFGKTNEIKFKARRGNRIIDSLIKEGRCVVIDVKNACNTIKNALETVLNLASPDDEIVQTYVDNYIGLVLTNDLNMKIKLSKYNIEAREYSNIKEEKYDGYVYNIIPNDIYCDILTKSHKPQIGDYYIKEKYYPYSILVFVNELDEAQCLYFIYDFHNKNLVDVRDIENTLCFYDIKPLSREQTIFMWLLNNDNIKAVATDSIAGVGKNLISIAWSLESIDAKKYKRLMYLKGTDKVGGHELGYYSGNKNEKLNQAVYPPLIYTLNTLFNHDTLKETNTTLQYLIDKGQIIPENLGDLRGVSLKDTIIILDECSNNDIDVVITALSRLEESSRIIILGSSFQIDNPKLNRYNNGLTLLINSENFKKSGITASINMTKSERSELAQLTMDIFNEYH